ncbi:MAG TPA: hypothetical protein VGO11_03370 [Chthoniobacteraceae bacterium]|jgi:hypothetical protein|nr:hypothetical protein [Chthoniobacteraceae bacterium]
MRRFQCVVWIGRFAGGEAREAGPQNDRKGGEILETRTIPAGRGCGGLQLKVKVGMMLEGYRPRRIVIVQPATWIYRTLPMEEQLFGRE